MQKRMSIREVLPVLAAGCLLVSIPAEAGEALQIGVHKKIDSKDTSQRKLGRGGPTLRKVSRAIHYEFDIRNMSPNNPFQSP